VFLRAFQPWLRRRVCQPLFAAAERSAALRPAKAAPPQDALLTVAQARRSA